MKAGTFKVIARVGDAIIESGDYWLPAGAGNAINCHPVKVSTLGIHYCRKLPEDRDHIMIRANGKWQSYYGRWEHEQVFTDCEIEVLSC